MYIENINSSIKRYLEGKNDGKVVCLTGSWGSGKTFFWEKYLEPSLSNSLIITISLYGKKSILDIESEIIIETLRKTKKPTEKLLEKVYHFGRIGGTSIIDKFGFRGASVISNSLLEKSIKKKTQNILSKNNTILCFDDFERKSDNIKLNELFGFIHNYAKESNCKILLIFNSEVFHGNDSQIYKVTKEKVISKYFFFKPSSDEYFEMIFESEEKYIKLSNIKGIIKNAFKKAEEKNGRSIKNILDLVFEWTIDLKQNTQDEIIEILIYEALFFIYYDSVSAYQEVKVINGKSVDPYYTIYTNMNENLVESASRYFAQQNNENSTHKVEYDKFRTALPKTPKEEKDNSGFDESEISIIYALYFYKYYCRNATSIDQKTEKAIFAFISEGFLPEYI